MSLLKLQTTYRLEVFEAMLTRTVVFHLHLIQDISTLRPLILLSRRLKLPNVMVLCNIDLANLDKSGLWRGELELLCAEVGISPTLYETPYDAVRMLNGRSGIVIAGSESNLPNHSRTHALFRALPSRFLRVTLQHGFECVGFLHNYAHDNSAGTAVRFAADVLVAWFSEHRLKSVVPAERGKLYVAGPPAALYTAASDSKDTAASDSKGALKHDFSGLVCENLHSVRFLTPGNVRNNFLDYFRTFAALIHEIGGNLHLRPHPASVYIQRQKIELPNSVVLNSHPLYKLETSGFHFCISAPSTVLFDFALAGVPVAVWGDAEEFIDTSNFAGLTKVVTVQDWWRFATRAFLRPKSILECQAKFLTALGMPADVEDRYIRLLSLG